MCLVENLAPGDCMDNSVVMLSDVVKMNLKCQGACRVQLRWRKTQVDYSEGLNQSLDFFNF